MFRQFLRQMVFVTIIIGLLGMSMNAAFAADYPKHSVNLIVPFSAGGGADLVARNFANTFEKYLGESVVVSNKDGGGGTIGASFVAHSRPDGYNVLLTVIGPVLIQPLYGGTDYARADLRPVATLTRVPTMIVVNKDAGMKSLEEFIARAKQPGRQVTVSVAAAKGLPHLALESFLRKAGINLKVMPYKGGNPAVAATLGGHVDGFCGHPSETLALCQSGDFIPIAVFAPQRIPEFPDVPTFKEKGYDVTIAVWRGLAVPKDTPDEVVAVLEKAVAKTMKDESYRDGLKKVGEPFEYLSAADTGKMWDTEGAFLEQLIKELGLYMQNKR